jgi:exosortase E/protease (VPEID-CTERM system)
VREREFRSRGSWRGEASTGRDRWIGAALLAAVVAVEILLISLLYEKDGFTFGCQARVSKTVCEFLAVAPVRASAVGATFLLFLLSQWRSVAEIARRELRRPLPGSLALHCVGYVAILAPSAFLDLDSSSAAVYAGFVLWTAGLALWLLGGALAMAPARVWLALARLGGLPLALAIPVALIAPELVVLAHSFWNWLPLPAATFGGAAVLLRIFAENVVSDPSALILGTEDFSVSVGPACSGVEGFALITGFMALYLAMRRHALRFPHALILIPIGIALSWSLNVVRIAALILIGTHVSPELAVEGFHSHAGWLMFTVLSLSLAAAAHATPWLRRADGAELVLREDRTVPPLREDWNAARLVPFIVFMAGALVASTFVEVPGLAYPLRIAATLAALLAFAGQLRRLGWRVDPLAVVAGVSIGVLWLATAPAPADDDPLAMALAALPNWALAAWVISRVVGTALVVPVVEELVFRSYLLETLDARARIGPVWGPLLAIAVSTALFAALHDRWIAAALAGLVFAGFALRRGRIADAIWCHAGANAVIGGYALATGRWSLI